ELVINGGFKDTLKVWSSDTSRQDIRELASDHEEADTRIASAWKVFEDAPDLLEHLREESQISADVLAKAEAFVCKLYNPGKQEVEINKERAAAFRKSKKDLDPLPPTQDALTLREKH
ncbi:unnamed protein product, partial [Porites evermanni]